MCTIDALIAPAESVTIQIRAPDGLLEEARKHTREPIADGRAKRYGGVVRAPYRFMCSLRRALRALS
jgi:hypothetical protein